MSSIGLTVKSLCCDLEQCTTTTDFKSEVPHLLAHRSFASSKNSLAASMNAASKENLLKTPYTTFDIANPVTTSIFDLFKIGPGPSSSHTIGPMKASFDLLTDLRDMFSQNPIMNPRPEGNFFRLEIHLYGSLSATGRGHKTHTAIVGGLMGWLPATCDTDVVQALMSAPGQTYLVPITIDVSEVRQDCNKKIIEMGQNQGDIGSDDPTPSVFGDESSFYPPESLYVGEKDFVWHDPEHIGEEFPHPNTMQIRLIRNDQTVVFIGEYYSVGGGFIIKKGFDPDEETCARFPYRYNCMKDIREILKKNPQLTWYELMMRNEIALTGTQREDILNQVDQTIDCMIQAVDRGLATQGVLPGTLKLKRKAAHLYENARRNSLKADHFLQFINAYSYAASEENAAGKMVVTAPTSGASGVFPGLIYFMKNHLCYSQQQIREGFVVSACIGFLLKHNASISGAVMGCQGEIGAASGMGAAMLAYSAGLDVGQVEAAAEIAIEHHLGLTCDPINGEVQVPCIQRNPFGAVKAYNAYLMSSSLDPETNKISLDCVIQTLRETGNEMSYKFKETSQGGLAVNFTLC